jgi:hypothetical protein
MGESDLKPLATWAAGFAAAILAVQWLLFADQIDVAETRFFSTAQSLSGAIIGGLLFGVGMVLARGCVSRLLVLGASGNLRGVFSIAIVALTALATYSGVLVPLRDGIGGLWSTASIGGNDLLVSCSASTAGGPRARRVLAAIALGLAFKARLVALAAVRRRMPSVSPWPPAGISPGSFRPRCSSRSRLKACPSSVRLPPPANWRLAAVLRALIRAC